MIFKDKVKKYFREAVKGNIHCNPALRERLLNPQMHPNVNRYLTLLAVEIEKVQAHGVKTRGRPYKENHIKELVHDMTRIFIQKMEFDAQKMHESDIARSMREKKIQDQKDLDATVDGNSQGIFAEMGVVFNEKAVGARKEKGV